VKAVDRFLQRWRIRKAAGWIRPGDRVLDVGCFDRTLATLLAGRVGHVTGVDPAAEPFRGDGVEIHRGTVPGEPRLPSASFDCITLLAVLEHVPDPDALGGECFRLLRPGGRLVATVPHPFVDRLLDVGIRLRLLDGMEPEGHHGFDVAQTPAIFERAGFRLVGQERFQLGLNRLFVFEKEAGA
jgi:SAM-dependent methyltransferase